jgi:hypothetical protein
MTFKSGDGSFVYKDTNQIWRLYNAEYSSRILLGCDAVQCCGKIPTFRRIMLPPSSGRRFFHLSSETTTEIWIYIAESILMNPSHTRARAHTFVTVQSEYICQTSLTLPFLWNGSWKDRTTVGCSFRPLTHTTAPWVYMERVSSRLHPHQPKFTTTNFHIS